MSTHTHHYHPPTHPTPHTGLNVARLAQVQPDSIIQRAAAIAVQAQAADERRRAAMAAEEQDEKTALAQQCRDFLRLSLEPGGPGVDVEVVLALQQRARALLAA